MYRTPMLYIVDNEDMNDVARFNTELINSILPYISLLLPYIVTITISLFIIYNNGHLLLTKLWNLFTPQQQWYEICFTIGGLIIFTYISCIIVDICQQLDKRFEALNKEKTELVNKIKIIQDENNELKAIVKKIANIYEIEEKKYK